MKATPIEVEAAEDFDPIGGDGEHSEEVEFAIDDDPAAVSGAWTTETYEFGPALADSGKDGVGISLDAGRTVAASKLAVRSVEGGWDLVVYGSGDPPPEEAPEDTPEWTRLGAASDVGTRQTVDLESDGTGYRYYLIWITRLTGDEGEYRVEITDARLFS